MAAALSPREPAPKLVSSHKVEGGTPRRSQSPMQARALAQGFTLRAGPKTMARLHRGVIHYQYPESFSGDGLTES